MPSIRRSLTGRDAIYLVMSIIVVLIYVTTANGGFPLDDSWIHQVYARNLAQNGEWAFVPGEPSGASTSPLFTVLLSISYALDLPDKVWTHLLGVLTLTATAMFAERLARKLLPTWRSEVGFLAGLAVVSTWHLIWAAASGMETMLFSMFTLAIIWLAWRELDDVNEGSIDSLRRGGLFGVVAGLSVLTRPEGAMLAGLAGLLVLIVRPQRRWRNVILWGVAAAIGFVIVITPYSLLNLHLTDSLLPATANAKYEQHKPLLQTPYLSRAIGMIVPTLVGGQFLLIPGILFFGVQRLLDLKKGRFSSLLLLLPLFWIFGLVILYAARLPATYQHGRYAVPILPSFILIGIAGTVGLVENSGNNPIGRILARSLIFSSAFIFVYFGVVLGAIAYRQDVRIIDEEMVASAKWIKENIPPEDLLAVHDIGAVGYFAPRPILDLAGLISPEVAPVYHNDDALWELMRERNVQYLMAFQDQLPGNDPSDSRLCLRYQSDGRTTLDAGGSKMTIYQLIWDGECPS